MAAQRGQKRPLEIDQMESDAKEFGVGVRCGGWRLGLLVARNVAPGKAGHPTADDNRSLENERPEKVSMSQFAELAGVSKSHVKYYYDAWELAAAASLVPSADKITLGEDDVCIDVDAIEDDENPKTHWTWFYQNAKAPTKPKEQKQDSKAEKLSVDDDESEDDEIDDLEDAFSESEVAEADSSIRRNDLLDILEAVQAQIGKLSRLGPSSDNDDMSLMNQIGSAAMDLSTTAMSMASAESAKESEAA